ncbi:MAG: DUF1553 domain-containing protein [Phycisphaerae bacterium]
MIQASLASSSAAALAGAPGPAEQEEFFETRVRPVLAEKCFGCHGPVKQRSGLRLDSRAMALKGNDSGPAVVPGDVGKSLLVRAIGYAGDVKMPPDGKLSDREIEALTTWVQWGAPWPAERKPINPAAGTQPAADPSEAARSHWAFQPVKKPPLPEVKDPTWVATPVDAFILRKLEDAGLKPSPPCDRRTLIRRATYDLTGLPPTPEQIDAFEDDDLPGAYERLIERLLASPRYGERWGRYWLDVARYADTKGYVFQEERRFAFSYTYRDYVIRAFNEDLPYDQFLIHQIAADQLDLGDDNRALAAMGYLTLGRRFTNVIPDIIDDRIDVVTRGMLGLTVTCARCHDHKYDPIPTQDYYSLYGVFASSVEPAEAPLIGRVKETQEYAAFLQEVEKRKAALAEFTESKRAALIDELRAEAGRYLVEALKPARPAQKEFMLVFAKGEIRPDVVDRWREFLKKAPAERPRVFGPWAALSKLAPADFEAGAARLVSELNREVLEQGRTDKVNVLLLATLHERPLQSMADVAGAYGDVLAGVHRKWKEAHAASTRPAGAKPIEKLPDPSEEELRQVLYAEGTPTALTADEAVALFDQTDTGRWAKLKMELDKLLNDTRVAPPRAPVLVDAPKPQEPQVFIRGNPANRGETVPRQFLKVLAGEGRRPFKKGSGRLELAQAIASRDNPLTARVMVNRIWLHHFGAGIVRTPSDFGLRGDRPTHPELLDYLAWRFMNDGWSIKNVHRLIMLSNTYRQCSRAQRSEQDADPDNRLLARANRRRLDFEAMRDSLLAVSNQLDLAVGGPAVDITTAPYVGRRTVYGFIERQNLPGVFRTFDFASPDTTSPQRHVTTVPQQALFMMNSPFVIEQARKLLSRPELARLTDAPARIRAVYRVVLGRSPTDDELKLGLDFVSAPLPPEESAPPPETQIWQYGYGQYDEAARRVVAFERLPHWTGSEWRGGPELPDPRLGWVLLNATGGHVGNDREHAAIRRWTAPLAGTVHVRGSLEHTEQRGDGVQAWIVSSRSGELGQWTAHASKAETRVWGLKVEKGEHLDFVVERRQTTDFDAFNWAPVIEMSEPARSWDAAAGFKGPQPPPPPPLDRWEQYAQVLLLTNEFMFVD